VIRERPAESVYALRTGLTPDKLAASIDVEEGGAPCAGVTRGEGETFVRMHVRDSNKQLLIAELVLHTLHVPAELGADRAGVVVHLDDGRSPGADQAQVTSTVCALIGSEGQGACGRQNQYGDACRQEPAAAPSPSSSQVLLLALLLPSLR
jgi:hypothetical protein